MKDKFTIMLPVSRSNNELANRCINHLLINSNLNIIVIDDFGNDEEYIKNDRVSFIHNTYKEKQPLAKIWNQCIKLCPTEFVIIASWRQRPTEQHFDLIYNKLAENYGMVTFDGLHFFSFSKFLITKIGLFDEGFKTGQFEDTDWFARLRTNDIGIYMGEIPEERVVNGQYIDSSWLENSNVNELYYNSKWTEDKSTSTLIQHKEEENIDDRKLFNEQYKPIKFKVWGDSVLNENLSNYFKLFSNYKKLC